MGALYFALSFSGEISQQQQFLPGTTTHGHFQIEMSCESCHTSNFTSSSEIQAACISCHQDELQRAKDSHPKAKFGDPRNADRVSILDARECVTCHSEHRPEVTATMGISLPDDYCYHCHQTISEDRPSHKGMTFDSCDDAGCHNYHDNTALYEDYLAKHLDEPNQLASPMVPARNPIKSLSQLDRTEADPPSTEERYTAAVDQWSRSGHALTGVNCTGCHQPNSDAQWNDAVDFDTCQSCHATQTSGWLKGKHGMRRAANLPALTVREARLPMRKEAAHEALTCNSCHDAHVADTQAAAVEACLTCHNDSHSQAYKTSSHFQLWEAQLSGKGAPGTGVSCGTCHLPTLTHPETQQIYVEHNQNDNLRPNEKMIRTVCSNCHGLGFSINSLADTELIQSNFNRAPNTQIPSLELVKARLARNNKPL